MANTAFGFIGFVIFLFYFGAHKFHVEKFTEQIGFTAFLISLMGKGHAGSKEYLLHLRNNQCPRF